MRQMIVTDRDAGQRFDKYLKKLLPEASSGFLYKMLRKKNITLNEKKAEGKEIIREHDTVKIFFSEETFLKFSGKTGTDMTRQVNVNGFSREASGNASLHSYLDAYSRLGEIAVIYEDKDILILNKPAGVLSQKAAKEDYSMNEWMIGYLLHQKEITEEDLKTFHPSVCNRLDRNTSGLILCGKIVKASQFLSEILRNRSLHKYYLAYVEGKIPDRMELSGYLIKDTEKNRVEIISEEEYQRILSDLPKNSFYRSKKDCFPEKTDRYQKIETVITPLGYSAKENDTKLEILLITGKSHQIRAHLAAIGHPVLGDIKYGGKPVKGRYQFLHACRVEFPEIEGEFSYLSGKVIVAPKTMDLP